MALFKNMQTLSEQLATLPKLYNSHIWITPPSTYGYSFLGISHYAKKYFTRLNKLKPQRYVKTNFGITNRQYIKSFIEQHKQLKQSNTLPLSLQRQWQRFQIKQNQPFCILETIQFDIQLKAPVDMRVIQMNYHVDYELMLLSQGYYFRVEILDPLQLAGLNNQEEYGKERKIFLF